MPRLLGDLQDGQAVSPEHAAEHGELHRDLNRALMALPRPQRLALTLYYVAGLRYRKIAEVVELPISTVKGRIQEGRKRLRRILGPTYERRLTSRQPATAKRQLRAAVKENKENVMAQLEELAIRYTSAGERAGIVLLKSQQSEQICRHQSQWRPGKRHLAALCPSGYRYGYPNAHARTCMCLDLRPADDYRFFAESTRPAPMLP